jgi:hypothetical protein
MTWTENDGRPPRYVPSSPFLCQRRGAPATIAAPSRMRPGGPSSDPSRPSERAWVELSPAASVRVNTLCGGGTQHGTWSTAKSIERISITGYCRRSRRRVKDSQARGYPKSSFSTPHGPSHGRTGFKFPPPASRSPLSVARPKWEQPSSSAQPAGRTTGLQCTGRPPPHPSGESPSLITGSDRAPWTGAAGEPLEG